MEVLTESGDGESGGGALPDVPEAGNSQSLRSSSNEDATDFIHSLGAGDAQGDVPSGISTSWHPAKSSGSGGGAMPPRGGSGGIPLSHPGPAAAAARSANAQQNAGASAASAGSLLSTLGLNSSAATAPSAAPATGTSITRNGLAAKLHGGSGTATPDIGGAVTPSVTPAFTLITLDYNAGSVFVPGAEQLATPGGAVDLRAQVIDSASGTYTYSWTTSGLTDATGISGTSSYDLTFHWNTSIATAKAESTTLTVTDPSSNVVSQTYTFWVPAASGSTTGGTTWPSSLDPGLIQATAPAVVSQNVAVVSATGAAETSIDLPSFNPNVSPLSLQYNSLAANALPIVDIEHPLDPTMATPSKVTAQLQYNGTNGTTWYYGTSSLTPGDIMQIGLQANASTLSTGRYGYTATVIDYRSGTPTTFTYSGTSTLINESQDPTFSALGAGWTVSGLEKIITASGGVILDEGDGAGLWFSGSFGSGGGTYTSPAGDFSTLVLNSNGTYTRTLTDGTVENFASTGLESTVVDRNGLTTTFGYSGNLLTTITDPFIQVTTFTYNGSNQLQSIKDPAGRFATFTLSSGHLTAVEYPNSSTWDYGYDSSGRLTSVTEPSSAGEPTKITTITYDSAERVGTITRADSTTEEFSAAQEQGWTNSGTSGSPATPTLLGQVGSTYTDPLGNTTTGRPDWRGMGLTDQAVDALGDVTTVDRDVNGLATITIDPMNRITQAAYDSKGNVTLVTNADGSTVSYGTYNSFAEPASMTDELGRITTYTYDSHGNRTVAEDPATNVTTYTYSSTQPGMLLSQTAPAPAGQSSYTLYSYQYDSLDRQTTITNADSDVTVNVYSSAGQVTKTTDASTNVTTFTYDQMNRMTGETDAAGSSIAGVSTFTYDAAGKQVTSTDPDNDTTTTTYDALDRQATVKTPDGGVTTYVYDSDGRLHVLTDPVGNATTFLYDSLGRQTTQISPSVNNSSGVTSSTQYDADGEVTQTTDADGRVITYAYDSRGDQAGQSWLSSGSATYIATYTYDSAQEMTGAADSNSLLTIAYDKDGRVGTIATSGPGSGQPAVTLTYGYDPSGDVTSIKDSLSGSGYSGQGLTTNVYDPALRLATITQSFGGTAGPTILESYNADGLVTETQRSINGTGTSVNTTYSYDAANNSTGIYESSQSLTPSSGHLISITEAFDPAARATSMAIDNNGSSTSTTYGYDASGQLTGSTGGSNDTYSYDLNGNPNATGYTAGAGNELTNSPGVTYTYDNDGNLVTATTSSGTTTYTYDYMNRITSVDQHGTVIATYTYDVLGRRIGIKDSGTQTWTVFNGTGVDANPYADFNGSGSVSVRYLFGPAVDAILARTSSSGTTAWYLTDQVGSVRYIENTSGTVLDGITYDAFGNIVSQTDSSDGDRFMFAGMQYDAATGIYYDHARYYDAAIGRFMSQDPESFTAGDTNLYRYVGNDPTADVDPSGMQEKAYGGGMVGLQYVPGEGWTWGGGGYVGWSGGTFGLFGYWSPFHKILRWDPIIQGPSPDPTPPLTFNPDPTLPVPVTGAPPPNGPPILGPVEGPPTPTVPFWKKTGHTFGTDPWWQVPLLPGHTFGPRPWWRPN
jgi:RHS repeat-associated protein